MFVTIRLEFQMPRFSLSLAAALLVTASAASAASTFTVTSGTTQVDTVVTPFMSAESGNSFYNYTNAKADPAFDLSGDTLHVYLHQETGTDNVSIGYIFNTNDAGDVSSAGSFSGTITGALATATGGITDDGTENFGWKSGDTVDGAATVNGTFGLVWGANYTDGWTINTSAAEAWSISLNASSMTGISNVAFYSGNAASPSILFLESPLTSALTITSAPSRVGAVPLPPAMALLGAGVVGLGAMSRRRK